MGNIADIFEAKTMQRMVKMIPETQTFLIDTFFKDQTPSLTEKVQIDFVKEQRVIAPFVHPKRGGKVIDNEGYETKEFTTPLLMPSIVTDIERLYQRMAGENPYSGISPEERATRYAVSDLAKLEKMVKRRKEWMAAHAIFGGNIPVKGENVDEVIDFSFTNHELLEKPWSDSESDPTEDMMRWKSVISLKSGREANVAVCSRDVMMAYICALPAKMYTKKPQKTE